ncbi:type II secretion system F family protein [Chitinimonas koreensis]|uniref:type II secretion system F family protein n=1 Tax=Chitinimonas koreensis TaxID=356302 RepID=UPI0004040A0D|nr:type II secretion system F family protein [Chitinimonas koreensis]QNM97790.1 type II secretion system F family protein [Chitinimonas koreensis]
MTETLQSWMNEAARAADFETTIVLVVFICGMVLFWCVYQLLTGGFDRYQQVFSDHARAHLEQMFVFVDISQLFAVNVILVIAGGMLAWLFSGNMVIGAIAAGALAVFPRFLVRIVRERRHKKLREQLPDASMLISGALRAGAALPAAMAQMVAEMPVPISQEFDLLLREQRIGVEFESALENLEKRVPLEEYALFCAALKIARETGGNLAETLERLSDTLRQKAAIEGKIRALTAQGKLQGWVVGLLPVLLIFFLFKLEPVAMHPLFTTWYGWVVVGIIAVMEGLGAIVIKKIITIDV